MIRPDTKWLDRRATDRGSGETPGDRLRAARLKAGYGKAVDAARAFGWEPPTYHAHENGTRGLTARAAEKYARAYHVLPSWLLFGGIAHGGSAGGLHTGSRSMGDASMEEGTQAGGLMGGDGSMPGGGTGTPGVDGPPDELVRRTLDVLCRLITAGNLHAAAETAEGLTHLLRARLSRDTPAVQMAADPMAAGRQGRRDGPPNP